eukprot:g509.t1
MAFSFGATAPAPAPATASGGFGGFSLNPTPAATPGAPAPLFGAAPAPAPAAAAPALGGGALGFGATPAPAPAAPSLGFGASTFGAKPAPAAGAPTLSFGAAPAPAPAAGTGFSLNTAPAPAPAPGFGGFNLTGATGTTFGTPGAAAPAPLGLGALTPGGTTTLGQAPAQGSLGFPAPLAQQQTHYGMLDEYAKKKFEQLNEEDQEYIVDVEMYLQEQADYRRRVEENSGEGYRQLLERAKQMRRRVLEVQARDKRHRSAAHSIRDRTERLLRDVSQAHRALRQQLDERQFYGGGPMDGNGGSGGGGADAVKLFGRALLLDFHAALRQHAKLIAALEEQLRPQLERRRQRQQGMASALTESAATRNSAARALELPIDSTSGQSSAAQSQHHTIGVKQLLYKQHDAVVRLAGRVGATHDAIERAKRRFLQMQRERHELSGAGGAPPDPFRDTEKEEQREEKDMAQDIQRDFGRMLPTAAAGLPGMGAMIGAQGAQANPGVPSFTQGGPSLTGTTNATPAPAAGGFGFGSTPAPAPAAAPAPGLFGATPAPAPALGLGTGAAPPQPPDKYRLLLSIAAS